jgi:hypothetical protein
MARSRGAFAKILLIALVLSGGAAPVAESISDWDKEALRASPHLLALGYLLTFENTRWLTNVLSKYRVIRKATKGEMKITSKIFYPNGKSQRVDLMTFEEVGRFLAKSRRLIAAYEKAFRRRGFRQLAMSYNATVSPGCSNRWFASGKVAVKQKDFKFQLSQTGKAATGIIVEDAIIVKLFGGNEPALLGRYGKSIELQYAKSKCRINLKAGS